MTSRPPPVPPENRPTAGPAAAAVKGRNIPDKAEQTDNSGKRGQTANTRINTTHQGYRQDR